MTLSEGIVKRLYQLMEEKNFSQYDFYRYGGMAKSTVSQILNGSRGTRIAVATLYEMTATMQVSLKEFFDSPIFSEITD